MPDIVAILNKAPLIDFALFLVLFAMFVLGAIQGAVRRFIGIISILFAFLVAANLRDPVGNYLASNWTQFPSGYDHLLAFAITFCFFAIAASVVTQGFYKRTDIYARQPIVDEMVGGVLGVVEGLLILTIAIVIFTSYTFPAHFEGEIDYLRRAKEMLIDESWIASAVRDTLVPGFMSVMSGLMPGDISQLFH